MGYPDELRLRPTNVDLLKRIAQISQGRYAPRAEEVFAPTTRTARRATPLWPYLLAVALLIFVVDVALRRIDFSLLTGRIRKQVPLLGAKPLIVQLSRFRDRASVHLRVDETSMQGLAMRDQIHDRLRPVVRRRF